MPAKRKCKEVIARERSKSANENAAEDQSCTMHEDTSNVEGHTSSFVYHIYPHIVNYNYTTLVAKESVVTTCFVIYLGRILIFF